ncbi:AMP-binding protein [Streptomyces sp. NPDC055078]
MEHNIWQVFEAVSTAVPERTAVVDGERRFSYAELADRSRRFGAAIAARGLGLHTPREDLRPWELGQDTVALLMYNRAEYLEASLGGYAARTAPLNLNYSYVPQELRYVLNDADASALVYQAAFAPLVAETLPTLDRRPLLIQVPDGSGRPLLEGALDYEAELAAADPTALPAVQSPDDVYVVYTGGTTGMPKGVLWRQADFWNALVVRARTRAMESAEEIAAFAASAARGAMLVAAPLMHGSGHSSALTTLTHGETVVFGTREGHLDPAYYWSVVEREKATITLMIGEAYARPLCDELERGTYDASSLRVVLSGGAALTARSRQRLAALLPHMKLFEFNGSSETGAGMRRRDGVGGSQLEPGVFEPAETTKVLDGSRTRVEKPGHQEAGWFAKSGAIPLGYLGDQGKTEATFTWADGVRWSVPGDRAKLRADGLIEMLGRDATTINTGGEKVFAEEVEEALLSHPQVTDAAVTGRPSARWGQEVTALIALAEGASVTDEDLKAAASEYIARYKLPKAIIRVEAVQRTASGKVDRSWAKETAEASVGT